MQTLDDSLNPEVVPAVETWFSAATNEGNSFFCFRFRRKTTISSIYLLLQWKGLLMGENMETPLSNLTS